jgi:hypothetical protein
VKVLAAEWRSGRYQLAVEVGTVDLRVWQLRAKGSVDNVDGLMVSLLGQMARQIPALLPGGIERSRIIDFMFDQLFNRRQRDIPLRYRRLSKGISSSHWISEDGKARLLAKHSTSAQAFGEIMLHPSLLLARQLGYCPVRTSKGCAHEIVPDIYAQHADKPTIVVIDEKKPRTRDDSMSLSPMGIIITGKRNGLEKWARRLAARSKRPLLVISRQDQLRKVMHYLKGAVLIETDNNERAHLGNLRADVKAIVQHERLSNNCA